MKPNTTDVDYLQYATRSNSERCRDAKSIDRPIVLLTLMLLGFRRNEQFVGWVEPKRNPTAPISITEYLKFCSSGRCRDARSIDSSVPLTLGLLGFEAQPNLQGDIPLLTKYT